MVTVVLWYQEHESLKAEDSIEQVDQWCSALHLSGPAETVGQEGTFDPRDFGQVSCKGPRKDCLWQNHTDRFKTKHWFISENANVAKICTIFFPRNLEIAGKSKNGTLKDTHELSKL